MAAPQLARVGLAELEALQEAFDHWVDTDGHRIGHHFAHVACETWIAAELAYLVNKGDITELEPWSAILENQRVDLTLVPRDATSLDGAFRIELKLVDTGYWKPAWQQVQHDLERSNASKPKPPTDIAGVFLLHSTGVPVHHEHQRTSSARGKRWREVPEGTGRFALNEVANLELETYVAGQRHELEWTKAVRKKWNTYHALCRMIWVAQPEKTWTR